jgi:L-ascorbate metabolism protein UlaG (beta-lactamase superfamily)
VLLQAGTRKVLIDGLFLKYETGYAVSAESTQAALQGARAPFDAVDVVLVTHRHGDHFHPGPVVNHLRANPRATLVASRQVVDSLRGRVAAARDRLLSRVISPTMPPGTRRREVVNGINIEILGLPHGGHPTVEHMAYIVELGGRRVLHVGDAELSEATLARFRLDIARIDVALLPYWVITNRKSRLEIEKWIRPKHIVAFHVWTRELARATRAMRAALPGAVTFTRSLETRTW